MHTVPNPGDAFPDRPSESASGAAQRSMWITPGRVFYAGLLGAPSVRRMGGWIIYFSGVAPLRLSFDTAQPPGGDAWREGELGIVAPYRPHRVACDARHLSDLIIEPERIDLARLEGPLAGLLQGGDGVFDVTHPAAAALLARLRDAQRRLVLQFDALPQDDAAFDAFVFGTALPARSLDPRIARALALLDEADAAPVSAQALAAAVNLSFSRFVHLFKEEVGVPLRTFRSWKRARSVLKYVRQDANLTQIAQHTGYPDSAHFSRSIREVFGLQPKNMMAGSRRIALHGGPGGGSRLTR